MKDTPDTQSETDERAVDAVISREIEAFFTKDFDAWCACYLQSPRLRSTMMSHELGLDVRQGWEAHVAGTEVHFQSPPIDGATWEKVTEQITVQGDMAWLTCRARTNSSLCMMGESYETWILERHHGDWKIVCVNVMAARSHLSETGRIALDAKGKVQSIGTQAQQHLARLSGFEVRAGKLRAKDPVVDRQLQEGIARAGALHGYFEQAAYAEVEGQRFAYPLVLDHADGAGHQIILITVQDRETYVDIGLGDSARLRVDASAQVFDLSDNQHRIVAGIVAGRSLPDLAQELGISPATAKTHLQRVYQKTGTSTKTALVRTLLSLG